MEKNTNTITCSFTMDRAVYNAYKSIVSANGENVKGNIVRYMQDVINYGTSNEETLFAMKEVDYMLESGSGKKYDSVDDLFEELNK